MTPAPVGLRCPEHSGKPQGIRKVTAPAQRAVTGVGSRRTNVVTLTLIGINVAVYLAELAARRATHGTGNWIYDHGAARIEPTGSACCHGARLRSASRTATGGACHARRSSTTARSTSR